MIMKIMDMTSSSGTSPTKTIGGRAIEDIGLIKAEPYTDEITRRTTYKIRLYDHNGNWTQDIKPCRTKEEALKRFKNALNRKKEWEEKFEAKYADVKNLYASA